MPQTGTGRRDPEGITVDDRLRALSKRVFGSMDRLEVALAIAQKEDPLVDATELSEQLKLVNNRVRAQLLVFADGGFLTPLPHRMGEKRHYLRCDSPFWDLLIATAEEWSRA